jgi:hypothetical protein
VPCRFAAGHADCALAAARVMLHPRLPDFNGWLKENGLGDGFHMGIGLSTGPDHVRHSRLSAAAGIHHRRR